uniref:WGS project CBMG000000000 data, contig CS5907-c003399 n=1 Tax=Fusarium acuminatum CS5907 TaxID=1318461 RepID=A0A090M9X8_9HYPO|nr:unnamed protein product [Fusarium acuminatum CS5907]
MRCPMHCLYVDCHPPQCRLSQSKSKDSYCIPRSLLSASTPGNLSTATIYRASAGVLERHMVDDDR